MTELGNQHININNYFKRKQRRRSRNNTHIIMKNFQAIEKNCFRKKCYLESQ